MKTARRILAIGTALMMISGCLTAYAADEKITLKTFKKFFHVTFHITEL